MTFNNSHVFSFHIQIKSSVSWKTLHRLHTYFTIPFLYDSLSNLVKPSNWLADISDDADYVTRYSEGKLMCKNMREQSTRFPQLLALLSLQYLRSERSEICGDASSALGIWQPLPTLWGAHYLLNCRMQ